MQIPDVIQLQILGMQGKTENSLVRHFLKRVPNVGNVSVDEFSSVALIMHQGASDESLIDAVHTAGFGAYRLWGDEAEPAC